MTQHDKKIVGADAPRLTLEQHMEALEIARKVLTMRESKVQPVYLSQHEEWLLAACVISFDEQGSLHPHSTAVVETVTVGRRAGEVLPEPDLEGRASGFSRLNAIMSHDEPIIMHRKDGPFSGNMAHLNHLGAVLDSDQHAVEVNDVTYQASWKKRGGTSAFENLCRKWDRLYARCERMGWDIFKAIKEDTRREGVIDDVRDLRRYLVLVECEAIERGDVKVQTITNGDEQ